jgi:3-deoxy-7-phosphoheptulonate synthase
MPMLITPNTLQIQLPLTAKSAATISAARENIIAILNQQDDRLIVVVGPCSIHHADSALCYAKKLQTQIKKHGKTLCIVMRTYIEKARTSIGWKGFINDPDLNNTFTIEKGLHAARSLLLKINELNVPVATEIINPFTAIYFSDLVSWAAIGARTTESQLHREFASDLPIPIGFKNNTHGDVQVAIDAIQTAHQPHHFLRPNLAGKIEVSQSAGNPNCHVVLRGSHQNPNYDTATIDRTIASLTALQLTNTVMIDCSHGNSEKIYTQQNAVIKTIAERILQGDKKISGVMIESHLMPGKQAWNPHVVMNSAQSITDACIGWEDTEAALDRLSEAVSARRELSKK